MAKKHVQLEICAKVCKFVQDVQNVQLFGCCADRGNTATENCKTNNVCKVYNFVQSLAIVWLAALIGVAAV